MKILCISDDIDPLVYSNNIKTRFADIDMVLGAGDLPMNYYSYVVSSLNKPLLFVFGNHNLKFFGKYHKNTDENLSPDERKKHHGGIYVEGKCKKIKNVLVVGMGGSYRYNRGQNQYNDFEMFFKILKLIPRLLWNRIFYGRFLDIFLTHASPYGIHDKADRCHRGFKTFNLFMDIFKPKFLVHGHIHLYNLNETRETKYKKTRVVNAYNHFVVEL